MQLVAYGAQDVFLTGNPQITFFKTVYRRYTNFAIEAVEHTFVGDPQLGKTVTARIVKNGDLVNNMYLKVVLKSVDPEGSDFAWVRRVGHAIIRQVEVEIGGTKIDRQYGVWLDVWYELARKGFHEVGYKNMIGDVPELTEYNNQVKKSYTLYVPLQFWFNRFIGLSVPLIALQYHEMRIHVEFSKAEVLAVRDCSFDMTKIGISDASILVDYVYLDSDERRRFAQVGHEYLIDQLQWNGRELVQNLVTKYRVDFNHPTKEIIWLMQHGNYISGKKFVYYTHKDVWDIKDAATTIINKSVSIGNDPTDIVGGIWVNVPVNAVETVGYLNVSNKFNQPVFVNSNSLALGDYGITDKIMADVVVDQNANIICSNVETSLTIRDISFPVEQMTDTRFNVCDPTVYIHKNYGLLIDGSVNPVQYGLIQLNGHDRFDRREGAYFNYVQPEMHHRNTPADGVNVYSFSIFPEEHQPSGAANLSRIDNTDLTVWFNDPTFDSTLPVFNLLNPENSLWIFGVNYNVLRAMSGMAGLAYTVG